ncbi:hypothetical protein ILYODFUR_034096 [Ilyodon furcidens]|uniref:Uncharacterized protein n=1 Tax=Ilyodon furcidens TaxID=33524 RepID=A0ABV0TRT2_9TELE
MPDTVWMARLRSFAAAGSWPADEGNRPAPGQKKWYKLYKRIEKCPMMQHGQKSLFGGVIKKGDVCVDSKSRSSHLLQAWRLQLQVLSRLLLQSRLWVQVLQKLLQHHRCPLQVLPRLLHWDKSRELKTASSNHH